MPKRPPIGQCVLCLAKGVERNWDHVFPLAWYPDSTPLEIPKWKVPTCLPCNASHGRSENDLLTKLALCLDPESNSTSGIVERMLRGLDAKAGRTEEDAAYRDRLRLKILREAVPAVDIHREGILPGFDTPTTLDAGRTEDILGVRVSKLGLEQLADKIVRGTMYLQDDRVLESPFRIDHAILRDSDTAPLERCFTPGSGTFAIPPGVSVKRTFFGDDGVTALYRIDIWERMRRYAFVTSSASA